MNIPKKDHKDFCENACGWWPENDDCKINCPVQQFIWWINHDRPKD